jgi:hypothetical protein
VWIELSPLSVMTRTVKVAIIGSGLAGLTAAYLLASSHHDDDLQFEVHLFEKVRYIYFVRSSSSHQPQTPTLGMDSSSVSIGEWRIDVPMRSFQGGELLASSHTSCSNAQLTTRLLPPPHRTIYQARCGVPPGGLFLFIFGLFPPR